MTAWMLGGDEPTVLVTQTGDVEAAKRAALADPTVVRDVCDQLAYDNDGYETKGTPEERAARWLDQAHASVEYGRFACTDYARYEGYSQCWIGWSAERHERAHGETTAVRFTAKPYEGAAG